MPTGQLTTRIPMAVASSLSLNQSATIFASSTFSNAAPAPLTTLPASAAPYSVDIAVSALPSTMSNKPNNVTPLSPNRLPKRPPGIATATPGSIQAPTSVPNNARSSARSRTISGDTEAADWNCNAMAVRAKKSTARIIQRLTLTAAVSAWIRATLRVRILSWSGFIVCSYHAS